MISGGIKAKSPIIKRAWQPKEDEYLHAHYLTKPVGDIAEHLGRTYNSVIGRAGALGLRDLGNWTDADDQYLRENYESTDMDVITATLKRSVLALRGRASKLGLRRKDSPNIKRRGEEHSARMKQRRAEGYRNTGRTEVGEVRTHGGRLVKKVSDTGDAHVDWVPAGRAIWEELNGELPDGHLIICRDGNKSNLDPANLAIISKQELMAHNSITKYPKAVRLAAQDLGRFLAKLKKVEQANEKPE